MSNEIIECNAETTDDEHTRDGRCSWKLLIANGIITDEEFKAQLSAERVNYLAERRRLQLQ